MPDQPKQGIARWGSLPIEQRFREATKNLSHAECMRLLPLVKAWVAQKEAEYGGGGVTGNISPASVKRNVASAIDAERPVSVRIGNKSY